MFTPLVFREQRDATSEGAIENLSVTLASGRSVPGILEICSVTDNTIQ